MREITTEERKAWAAKGAETRRQREAAKEAAWEAERNDIPAAVALCRRIRDDETASTADRLHAVELLMKMEKSV